MYRVPAVFISYALKHIFYGNNLVCSRQTTSLNDFVYFVLFQFAQRTVKAVLNTEYQVGEFTTLWAFYAPSGRIYFDIKGAMWTFIEATRKNIATCVCSASCIFYCAYLADAHDRLQNATIIRVRLMVCNGLNNYVNDTVALRGDSSLIGPDKHIEYRACKSMTARQCRSIHQSILPTSTRISGGQPNCVPGQHVD